MVDVIHYFFDEDMRYGSIESAHMHGNFRSHIYKNLYEKSYLYAIGSNSDKDIEFSEDGTEIKPYMPPTEIDADRGLPQANRLDAPLN